MTDQTLDELSDELADAEASLRYHGFVNIAGADQQRLREIEREHTQRRLRAMKASAALEAAIKAAAKAALIPDCAA